MDAWALTETMPECTLPRRPQLPGPGQKIRKIKKIKTIIDTMTLSNTSANSKRRCSYCRSIKVENGTFQISSNNDDNYDTRQTRLIHDQIIIIFKMQRLMQIERTTPTDDIITLIITDPNKKRLVVEHGCN